MTEPFDLPPRLRVKEDGSRVAVCPACQAELPVAVTHELDESKPFKLSADEVVYGETAIFDWSVYEAHAQEHRDGTI